VFREFYTERDKAAEERQKSTVQARLFSAFATTAFQAHPYRNPPGGWASDIAALRRTDARAFFDKYFVPGNVTMTLVGDVNPAEAKRMAEKYFGAWPARPKPPLVHTAEPPQLGPKVAVIESPGQPGATLIGYKRPSQFHPDDVALDILQIALAQGRTGLLYKELISEKHLAQTVQAMATFPVGRYPNIFLFVLTPAPGHTPDELQKALDELLNRLKQQKLDSNTLARAKAQARVITINRLTSNAGLAGMLGAYQANYGDWRKLFLVADDYGKVSADDIQRVLVRYFIPTARTMAYTVLPGQSGATPAAKPPQPGDKP
jgi:predicted Zn-dependent peptidase